MNKSQMRNYIVTNPAKETFEVRSFSKLQAICDAAGEPYANRFTLECNGWKAERVKTGLTAAAMSQRKAAAASHWGNRGKSKQVRVDEDAANALLRVPEAHRRRVASDGIRSAVKSYETLEKLA